MALLFIIALFVIGPIAEIYVLLAAGGAFGVWPVIAACIGTAILGGFILRLQGLAALKSAQKDMRQGRPPVEAAADGVFLVVAAPFLMTPGFITDAIGFSLLIPPVRRWIARTALKRVKRSIERGDMKVTTHRF